jgi:hypothetical protein
MSNFPPLKHYNKMTIATDGGAAVARANIAHYTLTSPDASSATYVHAAITLPNTGTTIVTTGLTNPDVPRIPSATGNASGIAGNVVLAGTDINDEALSETIALNGSSTVLGTKAFKSITSVTVPAKTNGSGDTVTIGVGNKLGLPHKLSLGVVIATFLNNVRESALPTLTVSSTVLALNTFLLGTSLNNTKVDLYYLVN